MTLIDSHCHLDDYADIPQIIANAHATGVDTLLAIGIGDGPDTMHCALSLAHQHPEIFASVGIHPEQAHQASPEALAKLTTLADDPRCIAVGEIGLDYYHLYNPDISTQQAAFIAQMKIAAAVRKPIIIHCRTSELAIPAAKAKYEPHSNPYACWDDLLGLIAEHWTPAGIPGIMHCFSGNEDQAARSLAANFYLSFAGNLTYPKSTTIQAVARTAPADRILVETDCPFLTPVPRRGETNEPAHTAITAQFLADLRSVSYEEIATQTTANFASRLLSFSPEAA
jgi:TatD DNase family protein